MNRLNLGLGFASAVGGVVGLVFQAWGLAAFLLLVGALAVMAEVRAHRRHLSQSAAGKRLYLTTKAAAADAANQGVDMRAQDLSGYS